MPKTDYVPVFRDADGNVVEEGAESRTARERNKKALKHLTDDFLRTKLLDALTSQETPKDARVAIEAFLLSKPRFQLKAAYDDICGPLEENVVNFDGEEKRRAMLKCFIEQGKNMILISLEEAVLKNLPPLIQKEYRECLQQPGLLLSKPNKGALIDKASSINMLGTKELLEHLKEKKIPFVENHLSPKATISLASTSYPMVKNLVLDRDGEGMRGLDLYLSVEWSEEGGLDSMTWSQMDLVTTGAGSGPIVCSQCVAVVNGVFIFGADGSFPVRDGRGLWISITGRCREPSEVRKANGGIVHMWDLKTNVRVATLYGRAAHVMKASIRHHKVARGPVIREDALPEFRGAFSLCTSSRSTITACVSRLESFILTLCTTKRYFEQPINVLERVPSLDCFQMFLSADGNKETLYNLINEEMEEIKKNGAQVPPRMSQLNFIITAFNLGAPLKAANPANYLGQTNKDYQIPPKINEIIESKKADISDWDLCYLRSAFLILRTQGVFTINGKEMTDKQIIEFLKAEGRNLSLRVWSKEELSGTTEPLLRSGIRSLCQLLTGENIPILKKLNALEKYKISEGLDAYLDALDKNARPYARSAYLMLLNNNHFVKENGDQMTDDEIRTYLRANATKLKEHAWTAEELGRSGMKKDKVRSAMRYLIDSLTK